MHARGECHILVEAQSRKPKNMIRYSSVVCALFSPQRHESLSHNAQHDELLHTQYTSSVELFLHLHGTLLVLCIYTVVLSQRSESS